MKRLVEYVVSILSILGTTCTGAWGGLIERDDKGEGADVKQKQVQLKALHKLGPRNDIVPLRPSKLPGSQGPSAFTTVARSSSFGSLEKLLRLPGYEGGEGGARGQIQRNRPVVRVSLACL